jgi:AcrR family transcriptional regulator
VGVNGVHDETMDARLEAMADPTSSPRRPRGSLSHGEIVEVARRIAERSGLDALSMTAVAEALGTSVPSIYWYVEGRDGLLDALTAQLSDEIDGALPAIGGGPWEDEVLEYFVASRRLLVETPIYRQAFAYRTRSMVLRAGGGATMRHRLADGLALLLDAGLSPERAADLLNACVNYTRGFIVLEHGLNAEDVEDEDISPIRRLDAGTYPILSQFECFEQAMWLDDEQFRAGLRLIVRGFRRQPAAAGR